MHDNAGRCGCGNAENVEKLEYHGRGSMFTTAMIQSAGAYDSTNTSRGIQPDNHSTKLVQKLIAGLCTMKVPLEAHLCRVYTASILALFVNCSFLLPSFDICRNASTP